MASNAVEAPLVRSSRDEARALDRADALAFTREEFCIPTKAEVLSTSLPAGAPAVNGDVPVPEECTYLVGNSLGLQPKRTSTRIAQYLATWRTQGVQGHFKSLKGSPLPTWVDADAKAADMTAPIIGAEASEVAVMQTLSANLHFLLCAFYRPDTNGRHEVILESKAFPSDHYIVESQVRHHGLPHSSIVTIEPRDGASLLETKDIISVIDAHADTAAVILLPGIQYYTGQLLDIAAITAHARKAGIFTIWDLAHAVGNVPLSLHDWDVDAAAWCTYKYLNSGPGCIGGLFVHSRHSAVTTRVEDSDSRSGYVNRLAGWWGNDKSTRFAMETKFHPVSGAAGFQVSNPSALDITSLCASLEVFELAGGIVPLRAKSERLTCFLEKLLNGMPPDLRALFRIITPTDPGERGAQLSLLLVDGLLDTVMRELEARAVLVDERRPDVIRVAPAPLYNTFEDCFDFVTSFGEALALSQSGIKSKTGIRLDQKVDR